MPFNPDRSIGRAETPSSRGVKASLLLSVALCGVLFMGLGLPRNDASQILDSGIYRLMANGITYEIVIPDTLYNVPVVDVLSRPGVPRFVVSQAHFQTIDCGTLSCSLNLPAAR